MLPENDVINSILQPIISPWYASLENPQKTQEHTLHDLIKKYGTTDYGNSHNALQTAEIAEYQKNFPIINYHELTALPNASQRRQLQSYST